jgi:hypothetical protein
MAKRETRDDAIARADRYAQRANVAEEALRLILTSDKPDAIEKVRELGGAGWYHFALYGATRAHGGIVVVTWRYPQQSDSIDAHYFDEWARSMRAMTWGETRLEIAAAADRMERIRNRLADPAAA